MELPSFGLLFSGVIIGGIGLCMFMYGRKQSNFKCIGLGLAMCVYPYFVHSLLLMWGIAAVGAAAAYFLPQPE